MKKYISVERPYGIRNISLFYIKQKKGHIAKLAQGTPANTLIIVLSGKIKCTLENGIEIMMESDTLTLFPKGQGRVSSYLEDTVLLSVHIETASKLIDHTICLTYDRLSEFSVCCLSQLSIMVNEEVKTDEFALMSYIAGILSSFSSSESLKKELPNEFALIEEAKLKIEKEFTKNKPITDYAKSAAMSESSFRRKFTLYVGKSPVQYRQDLRLDYVKLLVETRECTLSEAAERAGYNSLPYLCRRFKQKYEKSSCSFKKKQK